MGSSLYKPRRREFHRDPDTAPLYNTEEIPRQHTKVLLNELKRMRAYASMLGASINADAHFNIERDSDDEDLNAALQYISQLKDELATREHVPNKQEARQRRQAQAKRRQRR